jgi:dienelactone hydrolase
VSSLARDWSSIRRVLAGAVLAVSCGSGSGQARHDGAPAAAAPARRGSEVPGAVRVTFPSLDGDLTGGAATSLEGLFFRPPGDGPFPAIVALHGCAGLYRRNGTELAAREREYAERFVQQGYAVLLPDSFSPRGVEEICSRHEQPIRPGYERNRDAYGALAWLLRQPSIKADRVGLLGWSNGAITVLATLAHQTRSRPPNLAHDFRVAVAFYPDCRSTLGRSEWSPPVAPLHILIGEKDDWTPAPPCVELVDKARASGADVDIVVYDGAYHDFDDPQMKVHTRHSVGTTSSGTATIGMDPKARADAIERTTRIFAEALLVRSR